MNTFSGKWRIGTLAAFALLLMPLLGVGTASAFEVGQKVNVLVPDLQEFPAAPELMEFTCRAVTSNAVWLVQDESYVDNVGGFGETPKVVWGDDPQNNMVAPADFAELTAVFESDVWGTVTSMFGTPVDINGDGKVVIVLAAMPTKYNAGAGSLSARNNMYYVNPGFYEIEGTEMEVFYINIHPYTQTPGAMIAAIDLRKWNLANGLAYMAMRDNDPDEEAWLLRGLTEVAQYEVFGFTDNSSGGARRGFAETLTEFRKAPYLDITSAFAGSQRVDYSSSRGQQFLFFMYLKQRFGAAIIPTIAQNTEHQGMESVLAAIDPSGDPEVVKEEQLMPVYYDWLVANLHNDFRSDYAGGIYKYDFLEGTEYETWAHAGMSSAFTLTATSFPIEGLIPSANAAMNAPVWAAQYCRFTGYDQSWTTYFNGQFSDGRGARNPINSRWEGMVVTCDETTGEFSSVQMLTFDELYNTEFTLSDEYTYLIVTNNNPGGAPGMRYYISNDETVPSVQSAVHQNSVTSQFITVYSTMIDNDTREPEGYDWIGPIFHATQGDSTRNLKMSSFFGTVWTGIFQPWKSGNYTLTFAGYDSTGHYAQSTRELAVGYAGVGLTLSLDYASLDVPRGGAPSGAMITLSETDALGMAIQSSVPVGTARGRMSGIVSGVVSIPDVNGTISFANPDGNASVYRYSDQGWVKLDSWFQNGNISATVEEGGIYALGEGAGIFAPELPAQLVLGPNAPNPFTAQTAISFGLPTAGNVRVNVFDMTGRLVNTIANGEMAAANHTLIWDGTDLNGNTVGAGVYFCRLEAAGQVLTQKMLKVQ